jgi:hypothetical protein
MDGRNHILKETHVPILVSYVISLLLCKTVPTRLMLSPPCTYMYDIQMCYMLTPDDCCIALFDFDC